MKRNRFFGAMLGFVLSATTATAYAQPPKAPQVAQDLAAPLAIVGARVHTGAGQIVENATILIEKGMIQKVEAGASPPSGMRILSAKGAEVTPGLIDAITSIGLVEISQEHSTHDDDLGSKDPIHAAFRAADGYNPSSSLIRIARAEGITSVGAVPSGGLFSGQSAWADLDGASSAEALAKTLLAQHVRVGHGEDSATSAAASLLRIREVLDDARTFQKNRAAWERNQSRAFSASRLDLEALLPVLAGQLPLIVAVERATDILSVLALAKEFGIRVIIAGGAEAWRVAAQLKEAKVPVLLNPITPGPGSFDSLSVRDDNAALLHKAGVSVILTSFDAHHARKLRQLAGNAVRAGLPHEAAISAITRAPAEALGMADRYGTVEKGKVANLVVWSGDPLELSTQVKNVLIRGKDVDLQNRQTALLHRYRKLPVAR